MAQLRLLRIRAVLDRVPYTKQQLYRLMRDGKFPRQVPLGGGGAVGWLESEVEDYIKRQVRARATRTPVRKGIAKRPSETPPAAGSPEAA
jgi:prophage regulatory protein